MLLLCVEEYIFCFGLVVFSVGYSLQINMEGRRSFFFNAGKMLALIVRGRDHKRSFL